MIKAVRTHKGSVSSIKLHQKQGLFSTAGLNVLHLLSRMGQLPASTWELILQYTVNPSIKAQSTASKLSRISNSWSAAVPVAASSSNPCQISNRFSPSMQKTWSFMCRKYFRQSWHQLQRATSYLTTSIQASLFMATDWWKREDVGCWV